MCDSRERCATFEFNTALKSCGTYTSGLANLVTRRQKGSWSTCVRRETNAGIPSTEGMLAAGGTVRSFMRLAPTAQLRSSAHPAICSLKGMGQKSTAMAL